MTNRLKHCNFESKVPRTACPSCGYEADRVSGDTLPGSGDIGICIKCFKPHRFDDQLRKVPDDSLISDPEVLRVVALLQKAKERWRRLNG